MEITVLFEMVWEVMTAKHPEAIDCLQEDIDRLSKEHDDYMETEGQRVQEFLMVKQEELNGLRGFE
jgi:hypothetical protein|nr:MAG TPA_asm: hypothetical protein [Caudoviricetes sp.]